MGASCSGHLAPPVASYLELYCYVLVCICCLRLRRGSICIMINMHFDVFISVLSVMYRLLMYVFPYHYSALMALHTVLHVDTVLAAVALMIMTLSGPSPGLGRHSARFVLESDFTRLTSCRD